MEQIDLPKIINEVISSATKLKNKYTKERSLKVNWVCIFSQSEKEYKNLLIEAKKIGELIETTPSGLIYKFKEPFKSISGEPKIFKIRKNDRNRPERGDADFITKYDKFKKTYLDNKKFILISRDKFEMIELTDKKFDVRVYFSSIPPSVLRGIAV